ncbi:MAG TPA: PQQ-binding-like beta-propeller repeat protein [Tepidisphaeraceae bacterium]|jgi:outer membrane protein assembly factor BamB
MKHKDMKRGMFGLVLLLTGAIAWAQPAPATQAEAGKELNQGVYVRDSGGAVEKLAQAERMSRLKEWDKAADLYQEVLDKYSDRIVSTGKDGSPGSRYANVTAVVQERLGAWPREGLEAYKRKFEPAAQSLIESAGSEDAGALNQVVARYFATTTGKNAAVKLIELDIENGDFAAASWIGQRLLAHHPELIAERAKVLFLTGLAEHFGGSSASAQNRLNELTQKFATATGKVHGQDVLLADELATVTKMPAPTASGTTADAWPMFGGDATRGRVSSATGRVGAKQRQIALGKAPLPPMIRPQFRQQLQTEERSQRAGGMLLGVMPVVDRGELFFQDNQYIYARNVESGMALPGWQAMYPGEQDGKYPSTFPPMPPNTQMTVTVTDRNVLAVLRQFDRIAQQDGAGVINNLLQANGETKLVCLDRTTGQERWAVTPRQFADQNLKQLELGGSPVIVGDNVYINARGGKPMQFEDAYVLCLGLNDGKLRWACYLASGNAAGNMIEGQNSLSTNASHVAYDGGRIYASTELGAVACVDAYTGQIVWLDLYPRPQQNFAAMQAGMPQLAVGPRKPWAQNPVIVKDGKVFAMPSDARQLFVYDAATGEEIKQIPMGQFDDARTLLGVAGEQLIVNSDTRIFCINWQAYAREKPPEDALIWRVGPLVSPDGGAERNSDTIRGRGFVTSDSVFITTQWRLHRISLKGGKTQDTYPARLGVWGADEGPGNVLVTRDHVIIAGADSLDIYTDISMARARLDQAVTAKPQDPAPRLEYAEVMFASGQIELAMAKLDEAIALLGGMASMRPGADRDRVFSDSLAFAQRLSDPRTNSLERVNQANPLYDRAGAAAHSPQQQVTYRDTRARFAHARQDYPTELRLYQELLAEPTWRGVMINRESGPSAAAWMIAERAVMDLIRNRRELYAPYEVMATQALSAARSTGDAEQFRAVAQTYPVAKVAPDALFAAADAYEAAGKNRQATRVLNQIYRRYLDVDKARVLEALARNYVAIPGNVGMAVGRLLEGAKLPGPPQLQQALKLPDGTIVQNATFTAAADALQRYSLQVASSSLPDFKLKVGIDESAFSPDNSQLVISDVDKLLVPDRELRNNMRHDRIVTWTAGKGVGVYAVGKTQPLATNAKFEDAPKGIAWAGNDVVVWSGEAAGKLALLSGDQATTKWEVSVKSLPKVEVSLEDQAADESMGPGNANDGQGMRAQAARNAFRQQQAIRAARGAADAGESIDHVMPVGDRVIVGTSSGRVFAVELASGQVVWQMRVTDLGMDQLLASDDFVAVRMLGDGGSEIIAFETGSGQVVMRKTFPDTPPENMALAPDGTLVWTMPDRVYGKDLNEPEKPLKFGTQSVGGGGQMFHGAVAAEQLVVADGKILALSDMGQMVRVLSLETGREIAAPIGTQATAATNWAVWLRVLGPRLYIITNKTVSSRSVTDPEDYAQGAEVPNTATMTEAYFGKKHVVLLGQVTPANVPVPGAARYWLNAYSRARVEGSARTESGAIEVSEPVINPAGIDKWQPVDGGFYYRSLDRKVHFLQGAGG